MAATVSTVGVAFAAFCIWLAVRIVNRRERWAKWTLLAVVSLPVFYVASFGPACWASSRTGNRHHASVEFVNSAYQPLLEFSAIGRDPLRRWLRSHAQAGAISGWSATGYDFSDDWCWSD